jgi:hypothetical protein
LSQTGVTAEKTFEPVANTQFSAPEPFCAFLRIRL